jgi:hypothetical protein
VDGEDLAGGEVGDGDVMFVCERDDACHPNNRVTARNVGRGDYANRWLTELRTESPVSLRRPQGRATNSRLRTPWRETRSGT